MRAFREIGRWWSTVFALDYRSLSAFRIGMGCILLADVILRWPTMGDMYTDDGMLPRDAMREVWRTFDATGLQQWGVGTWSLHAISGDVGWQYVLAIATGIFAVLLALGAWTRVATIASFVLLVSVHNRIPFVLTSGDTHLRIVMFWAIFLPLARVGSIDALRAARRGAIPPETMSTVSAATAGLVIQIFILYFFSGSAKWNTAWWGGDGIFMAIGLTIYNTTWSQWFLQFPLLCHILSLSTVIIEVALPWLLFVPFKNNWWRWLNLLVFWAMHIGILFILSIGLFSYICMLVWLAIIPGPFWDKLGSRFRQPAMRDIADYPSTSAWQMPVQVFCAIMIPFMLVWNLINTRPTWVSTPVFDPVRPAALLRFDESENPIYRAYEIVGHTLGVGQHFQMFGFPPTEDAWFIYRATLKDGTVRDVFLNGREIPESGPLSGRDSIPHHHWRQIHRNLTEGTMVFVRQGLVEFMANHWNKTHSAEEQIEQLRLECYFDQFWPTPIPGEARGAVIWGTYPDGPVNAFDSMLKRALMGGNQQGF